MSERERNVDPEMGSKELVKLWLIPQDTALHYFVFHAIAFNGKRFTFGQGIGTTEDGGLRVSPVSQVVLNRLGEYSRAEDAQIVIVEMAHEDRIEARLRTVFTDAPDGSAIMVVCRTPKLYDALLPYTAFQEGLYPGAPSKPKPEKETPR